MREFEKWWNEIGQFEFSTYLTKQQSKIVWRAALEWYQSIAEVCEKDCKTPEDFKVLYFHLKQVLKNEVR